MTKETTTERPGCLSVIRRLFPRLGQQQNASWPLPYALRDDFLSPAEHSFYSVLKHILGEHFVICPKVSLSDLFFVAGSRSADRGQSISYLNKINRKHVDFLVCTPKTMRPVLGIELDDRSHRRADRQERDAFVDEVFAAAKLGILHIPAARTYDTRELGRLLRPYLEPQREIGVRERGQQDGDPAKPVMGQKEGRSGGQVEEEAGGAEGEQACPKCGSPMVLRTAGQGANAGKQFYGCSTYPRCRGMAAVD